MFAIKDLESIKNLASILVIPFFSAAYIADNALANFHDPILDWLKSSDAILFNIAGWSLWFILVVAIVSFVFFVVDYLIIWIHVEFGNTYVMALIGFTCLTAGVFVLSPMLQGLPISPLNPLWHLAFLCYGFSLIDRSAK